MEAVEIKTKVVTTTRCSVLYLATKKLYSVILVMKYPESILKRNIFKRYCSSFISDYVVFNIYYGVRNRRNLYGGRKMLTES